MENYGAMRKKADERFYGRIAFVAVVTAILVEALTGQPFFGM